jgi:hypothetical protein
VLYRALELLSWFDWLSPLITVVRNVINHPTHSFFIPYNHGWSGNDIKRLFKSRGIKSWGHLAINGTFMFTVRRRHAGLAQLILDQAGVPIRYGRVRSVRVRRRRSQAPQPAPDLLARLENWLDELGDRLGL